MKRTVLGWLVIVHALAHSAVGVWASADGPQWILEPLWFTAIVGYLLAALGQLRFPRLRDHWKMLMLVSTAASLALLLLFPVRFGLVGALVDVTLFFATLEWAQREIDAQVEVIDAVGMATSRHPVWLRIGWTTGALLVAYVAVVTAIRPLYLQWGATPAEHRMPLPGDDAQASPARYRIDHAITIHASREAIWPWLAQLGQDRGGFYSYAWLERAVGDDISNADRVHPEWQSRAVGDTVFATQATYLGGRFGHPGWRITAVEPNRVLVLENWGAFVLAPIDAQTTRLIVRTRGAGTQSGLAMVLAPLNVYVFEPAHLIMQRAMLRGIRDRAEAMARSVGSSPTKKQATPQRAQAGCRTDRISSEA